MLCYAFFFSYSCSLFFLCLYKFVSHFPLCVAITTNPNIHLYTYIDIYVVSRFRFRDMIKDLIAVFYFAIGNELNEFFVLSNVFFFSSLHSPKIYRYSRDSPNDISLFKVNCSIILMIVD